MTDGAILIDGQDIRDVTQDSLRENIGMIPQDPSLFHRKLMENIRYGRIDASDEEVVEAAKRLMPMNLLPNCHKVMTHWLENEALNFPVGSANVLRLPEQFSKMHLFLSLMKQRANWIL